MADVPSPAVVNLLTSGAISGIGGLFIWLLGRSVARLDADVTKATHAAETNAAALAAYKLEVAKEYVSRDTLRDLEQRLTAHLLRIEEKLDREPLRTGH